MLYTAIKKEKTVSVGRGGRVLREGREHLFVERSLSYKKSEKKIRKMARLDCSCRHVVDAAGDVMTRHGRYCFGAPLAHGHVR